MKYKSILLHLLAWSFLLGGCKTDLPDKLADIDVNTGIPLINSTMSLSDIVSGTGGNFQLGITDPEGYYKMIFQPESFDFPKADELIILPSQTIGNPFPGVGIPMTTAFPDSGASFDIPVSFSNASSDNDYLNGASLKNIYLKSGSIDLTLTSTIANTVDVNVTILNVINRNTNTPVKLTYRLFPGQATSSPLNFTNAVISLAGQNFLKIKIDYSIESPSSPGAGLLTLGTFSLSNLRWSRIEGKLGNLYLPIKSGGDTVQTLILVPPFNNNTSDSASFDIANPIFSLTINNSLGFNSQIVIKPLRGSNNQKSVDVTVSPFVLAKPVDPGLDQPVVSAVTNTSIPPQTVSDLFKIAPNKITYGAAVVVDGSQTTDNDFILSDSKISVKSIIEVPLYGYINKFKLIKDVDYPLKDNSSTITGSSSNPSVEAKAATLKLSYVNGIPLDIHLQIYFLNKNGDKIDSLFQNGALLKGADVDNNGVVTQAVVSKFDDIAIDENRFNTLNNECSTIRFFANLNSTNAPNKNVKFFPKDNLSIRMAVLAKAVIKFDN